MNEFKPIEATDGYPYGVKDFDLHFTETEKQEIADLLVGHKVTKVADDHLLLDDGTVLKLIGHEGGCSCSAGDYELTELNGVDNLITSVEFEDKPDDDWTGEGGVYRIFVFADNERVNLATFEGSDGNGYYGTGYSILVRRPDSPARPALAEAAG